MIKVALPPSTRNTLIKQAHASNFFRHSQAFEKAAVSRLVDYYRESNELYAVFPSDGEEWTVVKFSYGNMTPVGQFDNKEKAKSFMQK